MPSLGREQQAIGAAGWCAVLVIACVLLWSLNALDVLRARIDTPPAEPPTVRVTCRAPQAGEVLLISVTAGKQPHCRYYTGRHPL